MFCLKKPKTGFLAMLGSENGKDSGNLKGKQGEAVGMKKVTRKGE